MASAIDQNNGRNRRLELLSKIDVEINVNDAVLLTSDEGVLTALDDRYGMSISFSIDQIVLRYQFSSTLRIWLRRQTGKYWPSVCYTLESKFGLDKGQQMTVCFSLGSPTVIFYHEASRRLFCGCDTGLLHVS